MFRDGIVRDVTAYCDAEVSPVSPSNLRRNISSGETTIPAATYDQLLNHRYQQLLLMIISLPQHVHNNRGIQEDTKFWETMDQLGFPHMPIFRLNHTDPLFKTHEFHDRIVKPGIPCVIEGLIDNDPEWEGARRKWSSPKKMIEEYGDVPVCIKEVDQTLVRIPLRMFFQYANSTKADFPVYMCEKELSTDFLADYSNPVPFRDDLYQIVLPEEEVNEHPWLAYLLIGGRGSGSPLHKDPIGSGAWNALLYGRKRWCLFPPDTDPSLLGLTNDSTTPPAYWWQDVYPGLLKNSSVKNIEIIQKPGEVVFVPAGWHHAVINLETSIAVTQNFVLPVMLPRTARVLSKENPSLSRVFLAQLYTRRPELVKGLYEGLREDVKNRPNQSPNLPSPVKNTEAWIEAEKMALAEERRQMERAKLEIADEKRKLTEKEKELANETHENESNDHKANSRDVRTSARYPPTNFVGPQSGRRKGRRKKKVGKTSTWLFRTR